MAASLESIGRNRAEAISPIRPSTSSDVAMLGSSLDTVDSALEGEIEYRTAEGVEEKKNGDSRSPNDRTNIGKKSPEAIARHRLGVKKLRHSAPSLRIDLRKREELCSTPEDVDETFYLSTDEECIDEEADDDDGEEVVIGEEEKEAEETEEQVRKLFGCRFLFGNVTGCLTITF